MTDDADRAARACLLRASEPAAPGLVRHVRAVGVEQTVADIRRGRPIGQIDVEALQHRLLDGSGESDLEAAARMGIRLVCPGDEEWPPGLDDLVGHDADCLGLWTRGPAPLRQACEQAVAVVGTRAATDYGAT